MSEVTENFSDIYSKFSGLNLADTKHLRYENDVKGLHVQEAWTWNWFVETVIKWCCGRQQKRIDAGPRIWNAIAKEHNEETAQSIFKNVLSCEEPGHQVEITWKNMESISQILDKRKTAINNRYVESNNLQTAATAVAKSGRLEELQDFIRENLYCNLTPQMIDNVDRSLSGGPQNSFRKALALYYYELMAQKGTAEDDADLTFQQLYDKFCSLLKLTGKERDLRSNTFHYCDQAKHGMLDDDGKCWMLDQIYKKLYEPNREKSDAEKITGGYDGTWDKESLIKEHFLKAESFPKEDVSQIAQAFANVIAEKQTHLGVPHTG